MADRVDPATRSRIMSRVKSKNTRLEVRLRQALWREGIRGYRCHVTSVTGVPDLAWTGLRVAVFVDSAWWHGHASRWTAGRLPGTWDQKIMRNRSRDEEVNRLLAGDGWQIVRVWDFDLERDAQECVRRVKEAVEHARTAGASRGATRFGRRRSISEG